MIKDRKCEQLPNEENEKLRATNKVGKLATAP